MTAMLAARTLNISIGCPPDRVAALVSDPRNLPRWATAFCRSVRQLDGQWVADTPQGPVTIRFVPPNPFGVLDHYVGPSRGVEIHVPMRVVPNGAGSELLFTVFRSPGMSDEDFARDVGMVERDLQNLRQVLEQ